jgi:hypothetical protein
VAISLRRLGWYTRLSNGLKALLLHAIRHLHEKSYEKTASSAPPTGPMAKRLAPPVLPCLAGSIGLG